MRERITSSGSLNSIEYSHLYRSRNSCGAPWGGFTDYKSYGGAKTTKITKDIEATGFHACRKAGGFLPLNPFDVRTISEQKLPYSPTLTGRWIGGSCPGEVHYQGSGPIAADVSWTLPEPEPDDAIITAVVNGAVANSRTAAWDGLTFLAELRETKELFAKSLLRLGKFRDLTVKRHDADLPKVFREIRQKRDLSELPRASWNLMSQLWLEYRYGWMPIVYDVKSAVTALNTFRKNTIARGRALQSNSGSKVAIHKIGSYNEYTYTEKCEFEVVYRGWAASEFADDGRVSFDPLVTAYEVTTLSFVLDWFLDVGTWLEAISPFQPGKTMGSCASYKFNVSREMHIEGTDYSDTVSNWTLDLPQTLIRSVNTRSYSRFAQGTTLPSWNPRITLFRQLDSLALFNSFVNGFSRKTMRL